MGYYQAQSYRGKPWNSTGDYDTAKTTQAIQAAPGAARGVVLQKITIEVYTAAAQTVTIGDGTTNMRFSGNTAGYHSFDCGPKGFRFADNTAVSITSTAGPGLSWTAYGYIEGPFA